MDAEKEFIDAWNAGKVRRVSDATKPWFELTTEEVQEIHKWVKFKEEGTGPLPVENLCGTSVINSRRRTVDKNEGAHYINSAPENTITFFAEGGEWVMRITKDCISVNDNVSVDDAAQAVVAAIGRYLNKSKWVGLTDEEVSEYLADEWVGYSGYFSCFEEVMKWAEEKLKAKNA